MQRNIKHCNIYNNNNDNNDKNNNNNDDVKTDIKIKININNYTL